VTVTPVAFVNVADRARANAYYRDVLGIPLKSADDFGDFFDMGGALLRMTALPDFVAGPHPVLGWQVGDLAARMAGLRGRGVDFIVYPGMGQDENGVWVSPDGGVKIAWFHDSEGNLLSLTQ
jgi:catechol 2,3-dioxygenase-like lactoylglutathione lyase family enzyme